MSATSAGRYIEWLGGRIRAELAQVDSAAPVDRVTVQLAALNNLGEVQRRFRDGLSVGMLYGLVLESVDVPALAGALGAELDQAIARLEADLRQQLLALLGVAKHGAPGLWARAVRAVFPTPSMTPSLSSGEAMAKRLPQRVLEPLASHDDPKVREIVVNSLTSPACVPLLLERLGVEREPAVVERLIAAIARFGDEQAVPALQHAFTRFPSLASELRSALMSVSADQLAQFARASAPRERALTIRALGSLNRHAAQRDALIVEALGDPDEAVVDAAIAMTTRWQVARAIPVLQRLARAGSDAAFRALLAFSVHDVTPVFDLVLERAARGRLDGVLQVVQTRQLSPARWATLVELLTVLPDESPEASAIRARQASLHPVVAAAGGAHPELEAAIDAAPDDERAWLVWADALQASGDVRGELIALAHAGRPVLGLVEQHAEAVLPALRAVLAGEVSSVLARMQWRHGLPRSVTLRGLGAWKGAVTMQQVVAAVMGAPLCRFVQRLELGLTSENSEHNDWGPSLGVLGQPSIAGRLTELLLGAFDYPDETEISWVPWGDLSSVWALSRLEALHVRGAGGELGEVRSTSVRELTFESGGLPREVVHALTQAELPSLHSLELWLGSAEYGGDASLDDLTELLRSPWPSLRRLGLRNSAMTHHLVSVLAQSSLLKRLSVLDLSKGVLRDDDVEALLRSAPAFAHLQQLDLSENLLAPGSAALAELRRVLPCVVLADQRNDHGDETARYVAVSE